MEWRRGQTIGHGSTAAVSVATSCKNGETFAVKSIELSKSEFLQREQRILSTLSNSYIVGYKGYDIRMENRKLMFNLMMEYLPDGTLTDAIQKCGGRLREPMICFYTRQIVEGLEYLHSSGIVHCDVKGRNVLLGESGAKIADFGCSKWMFPAVAGVDDQPEVHPVVGGTPMFMAPEVARGEDQGFPADIWAFGCTIIEMATGDSPWPNATNAASLIYGIAFSEELPEIPIFLSEQAKDFISKCLRRDPRERWTAKKLLKHPFLEELNSISKQSQEFNTSSPTSILDQDIWNSTEESETLNCMIIENSLNSPAQRVAKLCSNSGKPNWTWEDSWTTIRSSKDEKEGNEETVVCGSLAGFSYHGMELERIKTDENLRNFSDGNANSKSSSRNFHFTECTDQTVVISHLNFERHKKRPNLNPIHFS